MTNDNQAPLLTLPPLSLYVHIPWCVRKCPYCDFNSHTTDTIPEQEYVNALLRNIQQLLPMVQGRTLQSVFFGGGTPSLFSPQAIETVLHAAQQLIGIDPAAELTLEANPGTTDQSRFDGYLAAGINRLSIGVQSFQNRHLHTLGRIHDGSDAVAAVKAAFSAGFDNINIDLMHGLPDQTPTGAEEDLRRAIDLGATHISWYQLTVEPNTAFFNCPPALPGEDALADIQLRGEGVLADGGYRQYEISAYCRPGRESAHNTNYWQFGDYLGIGAGAHSKFTDRGQLAIRRQWNTRLPEHYLERGQLYTAGQRTLTEEDLPLEFLMNTLRLTDGFKPSMFQQRTGLSFEQIAPTVEQLVLRDLLARDERGIHTTALGQQFLNTILSEF